MLSILAYHKTTVEYFKQKKAVWDFFSNHIHREEQLKEFKTELLKNTYKFDEDADKQLYEKVALAKEKLNLTMPVTLYQAQHTEEMNASISYVGGEAQIVFSGRILQLLDEDEIQAIIGHELSHILLYTQLDSEVEVADRIISAIANNATSTPAHYETARLFKLYTEIFCDRGSYAVTGNYGSIISSLVKISTGLQSVNADSYIKQAEEIFTLENATKTAGISHPENFIRARAIWLWHTKRNDAEDTINQMIEGFANIEELDIFRQLQISTITEQLIQLLLKPEWMQTPKNIALGKQYFGELKFGLNARIDTELESKIENLYGNLHDYFGYVLYDFATADKTLEDVPLGYCFHLADMLKLDKAFATTIKKEQKLTDKKVTALKKQSISAYQVSSVVNN